MDPERSTPLEIRKQGGERLRVAWADGHASVYAARSLRARCPCASCVDEDTGTRRVGEAEVGPGVAIERVALVGNYAVQVQFSDGHGTGLFSFDYLRRVCGCGECAAG